MKILHFADIHARDKDLEEIRRCCTAIIEGAINEKPDLIVNAGDTFDRQDVRLDSESARYMLEFHEQLSNIATLAVVLGTPSHDGKASLALEYSSVGHNVVVCSTPEQLLFSGGELFRAEDWPRHVSAVQAVVSMIPQPTKQFFQGTGGIQSSDAQIGEAMTAIFAGLSPQPQKYNCPHILVGHFQVGGAFVSSGQQLTGRDIEVSRDQLDLAKADIACLGHIHLQQQIGDNIFYSGSIYRKDFGEMEPKGFYIHELGRPSRFILTPTRKLLKIEADFTKPDSPIQGAEHVIEAFPEPVIENAHVRCQFRLWLDEKAMLDQNHIEELVLGLGAETVEFRLFYTPRETVRSANVLTLSRLRDKVMELGTLRQESISDAILEKADALEVWDRDQVLRHINDVC